MTRHVVFGTGQVGALLVERLVGAGHDVVAVNRSGRGAIPGATPVAGDATDPDVTRRVCTGADVVHFCLNAQNYDRWAEEFPPLQRAVLAGAQAAGARLVVLDNLYSYGPAGGEDLVETRQPRPTSPKAATRAAMTAELLQAHEAGRVEVAIGRASDYFGPGTTRSALGETVFGTAVRGRAAQVMGRPDLLHSYSYTPDVAAGLMVLATEPAAAGSIWHLPVAPARTTRQIVEHVHGLAGRGLRTVAAGPVTLRLIGIVQPAMREYLHTLYQFTERWVVDDGAFCRAFGEHVTPLDDALSATFAWYLHAAGHPAPHDPRPTTEKDV